jgi:glycosyl transferase family 87
MGALAIRFVHEVTQDWWHGVPVYATHHGGVVFPPATWVLLGPLFAWTALDVARWIWAALALAGLVALGAAAANAIWNSGPLARTCAWLAPFSMPALGDALGIGSLITVVLPLAVWAVLSAARPAPTLRRDLAAAGMFDLALAEPTVALPFLVPLVVAPRRMRPAVLAVAGYAVLTLVAAYIHPGDLAAELRLWGDHVERQAGRGYGNLQDWLEHRGSGSASFVSASSVLLAALGAFSWWCRRSDTWLLLGVAATVSRLWMAPRIDYDSLLIIPLMATARLALSDATARPMVMSSRMTFVALALILWIPLNFHFAGSTVGPWSVRQLWVRLFDGAHVGAAVLAVTVLVTGAVLTRRAGPTGVRPAPF